jgi:hypothetical protein
MASFIDSEDSEKEEPGFPFGVTVNFPGIPIATEHIFIFFRWLYHVYFMPYLTYHVLADGATQNSIILPLSLEFCHPLNPKNSDSHG